MLVPCSQVVVSRRAALGVGAIAFSGLSFVGQSRAENASILRSLERYRASDAVDTNRITRLKARWR